MPSAYLWAWDKDAGAWVKLLADEHGKLILSDADPFTIVQDTPEDLKHLPHGRVAGDGVYLPFLVGADGTLQVAIASLPSLNDVEDVNVPSLTDGDFIEWDTTTSKWIVIAHKDAATGVHGLGANYPAYSVGSSQEALVKNNYLARAYLSVDQDAIPNNTYARVEFAGISFDPNDDFGIATDTPIYDNVQSDADSDATHIEDDDATFDINLIRYALVSWTSDGVSADAGTGYIVTVDSDTLTLVKATGANFGASYYYTINHAEYTVPVTGYYDITCAIGWEYDTTTASMRYRVMIQENTTAWFDNNFWAAGTSGLTTPAAGLLHFTAGGYIKLVGIHYAGGGNEPNIKGSLYITWLAIRLVQAD